MKSEFKKFCALVSRNIKCYFKDKFLFFVSLITPMILLVLFATFLRSVYLSSFDSIFRLCGFVLKDRRVEEGLAGAWLLSSILSVSSVTVAVCSNAVMINDKIENSLNDFLVTPVKGATLSLSYFVANFIVTTIIMLVVLLIGFIYLAAVGWYIPAVNVALIFADILCCVLFGTLLAGVFESFISTQGGLSALSTLVSSLYGFICGAYMPLSQFAEGVRNFLCCLPGTYSVGIVRNHFMSGYVEKLGELGLNEYGMKALMDGFDGNLYCGGTQVPVWAMYTIVLGTCAVLLAAYVAIVLIKNRKKRSV